VLGYYAAVEKAELALSLYCVSSIEKAGHGGPIGARGFLISSWESVLRHKRHRLSSTLSLSDSANKPLARVAPNRFLSKALHLFPGIFSP
jgi:hypothetical protein